jgi:hypothetical protein
MPPKSKGKRKASSTASGSTQPKPKTCRLRSSDAATHEDSSDSSSSEAEQDDASFSRSRRNSKNESDDDESSDSTDADGSVAPALANLAATAATAATAIATAAAAALVTSAISAVGSAVGDVELSAEEKAELAAKEAAKKAKADAETHRRAVAVDRATIYVAADIESSDSSKGKHGTGDLVQLAATARNGADGAEIVGVTDFNSLIKPRAGSTWSSHNPHAITVLSVKDAPGIEEVWGLFVDWIAGLPGDGDVVICCWNGKSCDFAWFYEMTEVRYKGKLFMPPRMKWWWDMYLTANNSKTCRLHPSKSLS